MWSARLLSGALLAASLLSSVPSPAQPADAAITAKARTLAEAGLALYDRGDYRAALEKLDAADRLVAAPSLRLYAARCLARLGRLREAAERYRALAATTVPANASEAFRRAPAEAAAELAELEPKIPRVRVSVLGSPAHVDAAELDGRTLSRSELGGDILVDPGDHQIVARRGTTERRAAFSVAAGEKRQVVLRFDEPSATSNPVAPPTAPDTGDGNLQRTLGIVAIGAGVVGVGLGIGVGIAAANQEAELLDVCGEDRKCASDRTDDVEGYDRLRVASTIGFIAGGVLAAGGVTLILTAPRRAATGAGNRAGDVAVGVWMTPSSLGLRGRF